jgi:hypothetical protein
LGAEEQAKVPYLKRLENTWKLKKELYAIPSRQQSTTRFHFRHSWHNRSATTDQPEPHVDFYGEVTDWR